MKISLIILAASLTATPALAHDFWTDGEPVGSWVKAACCGPSDAHHLNPSAVHIKPDGVHIDGLTTVIPMSRVLPSPDGTAWGFWRSASEPDPTIFCLFLPDNGV